MQKKIITIIILMLLFCGCQNTSIEEYNSIVSQHSDLLYQANNSLTSTINYFNNKKYETTLLIANECIQKFSQARDLSQKALTILENDIKHEQWLVEYKKYEIETENLRIDQCYFFSESSEYFIDSNQELANENIKKIGNINQKYDTIYLKMQQIKNNHSESFK